MPAAENEAIVRRIFDAFARKEPLALRGLFADDAVWSVPGRGVMAGEYDGREAIFRFLANLPKQTDGTYGSELIDVLASDDRAAALYRARGTRHGRTLELEQVPHGRRNLAQACELTVGAVENEREVEDQRRGDVPLPAQ